MVRSNMPRHLWFEVSSICNLHCPLCPTGIKELHRKKKGLSFDFFKQVFDQVQPFTCRFWNYGEPFLNRHLYAMIDYAEEWGARTYCSTNGFPLLSEESIYKLSKSRLSTLYICLDGCDQKTVEKYRVGIDFERIYDGLLKLLCIKPSRMQVIWQFIVMSHNEHQIERAKQMAKELNIPLIFKTVSLDMTKKQGDPSFLPSDEYSRYYLQEGIPVLKQQGTCTYMDSSMVILSDGRVCFCCYDSEPLLVIGDANTQTVKEIWNGEKANEYRKRYQLNRKDLTPCNRCPVGTKTFL